MCAVYTLLLSLILLSFKVSCGQNVFGEDSKEESEDFSDWRDPTDMINYDLVTGKMRNVEAQHKDRYAKTAAEPVCGDDFSDAYRKCKANVSELQMQVSVFNDSVTKLTRQVSRCSSIHEEVFFHQYVRSLLLQLSKLAAPVRECKDDHYQVDVHISPTQYKYLKDYVDQKQNSTAEVHSILSSMLRNFRWVSCFVDIVEESSLWQQSKEWLWIVTQVVALTSCTVWMFLHVQRSPWWILTWLVTSSFVVSVPWTWWHLYKKEIAKRHAEALQSIPESCWSDQKSLWSFLTSWFWNRNSECVKRFEAMEIDPLWEVPPTKAVAVTFVKFFLEPAGHIGDALNRLVTAAFKDLPFYLWLPVFVLIVLLIILSMFFASGYRVRGWLWNIEPHRPVEPLRERIQQLEQGKEALQLENHKLQRQLAIRQEELTEQRARQDELRRQNTLLYNQLPGIRGEGDGRAIQMALSEPGGIISLHSDPDTGLPVAVEEAGPSVIREAVQEEDYEFINQ